MKGWPAINPQDSTYQRDLASLQVRGAGSMSGMHHEHGTESGMQNNSHQKHDTH
jgi:hypothetical protein